MTMLSRQLALIGAGYMVAVYRGGLLYRGDLVEFEWVRGGTPNNVFFKGNVYGTRQGQDKDAPNLRTLAGLSCHHSNPSPTGFNQSVCGMLWTWGISPTIDDTGGSIRE